MGTLQHAKSRDFEVQQKVMVRNLRSGPKWIPGVIVQKLGSVTYTVQVDGGERLKKHVDQIRRQGVGGEDTIEEFPGPEVVEELDDSEVEQLVREEVDVEDELNEDVLVENPGACYPSQQRKQPERYM